MSHSSLSGNCERKLTLLKKLDELQNTLLHLSWPWPGVTFTREYTRQRSTDCVGVPRLPPSTPRTVQQTLQRKSVREKEGKEMREKKRGRDTARETMCMHMLVSATRREKRDGRKTEKHRARPRKRIRVCPRVRGLSACSCVFRVPNARNKRCLSAAT